MVDASPSVGESSDSDGKSGKNKHGRLSLYIVIAIVAAIVLALISPRFAMTFDVGGQVFLRLLQMVVVPLVMASVMSGILGLGDVRKLGRPGGFAIIYYLSTTILAVATGLCVVNIINPGVGMEKELVEDARAEGGEEINQAAESRGRVAKQVTWDGGVYVGTSAEGKSDETYVASDRRQDLQIRIKQTGEATTQARVRVFWMSKDEKEFSLLIWKQGREEKKEFKAGKKPGVYQTLVPFPDDAKKIYLEFQPQAGGTSSTVTARVVSGPPTTGDILKNLFLMLFTDNLLGSMVAINLLPLIVFSIVFAAMLTTMGKRSETVGSLVVSINDALMNFILLLMKLAPIGIFCLVAARFGKAQAGGQFIALLKVQSYYMSTVLIGLAIHGLITLPAILYFITRRNPYRFMVQMSQAVLTAFSTASSTATLPVTMECAETNAGISKRSTEFVLPLGATINMDGTALYEAAAAIFIAQAYAVVDPSFQLDLLAQLTIAVTATLAAIGAAGIPEAGLVTMLIVLNAVGLPLELIGLILPIDWLLDRFRTAVNAFGDSVGAAVVDGSFPKDEDDAPSGESEKPGLQHEDDVDEGNSTNP